MAPGEQLDQLARAFERGEVRPFLAAQAAVVEGPLGLAFGLGTGAVHQGQGVFGQVRGDAGVDILHLAGLALEGCIQAPAQHVEVTVVQ